MQANVFDDSLIEDDFSMREDFLTSTIPSPDSSVGDIDSLSPGLVSIRLVTFGKVGRDC